MDGVVVSREVILHSIRAYFDVKELVCDHTYDRFGERSWQFLDTNYLHALLIVRRDILKTPMVCNVYRNDLTQRGLRCNRCYEVRSKPYCYLSAHCLGKAGDFTVQGMSAYEAREHIKRNADLLPCPVRLEKDVSWLHLDVLPQYGITDKVYEFVG